MVDVDGDGYGDSHPSTAMLASGVVAGTDCDDSNDMAYPWGEEWSGHIDNNCDGLEAQNVTTCRGNWNDSDDRYFLVCSDNATKDWEAGNDLCFDAGYDGLASVSSDSDFLFWQDLLSGMGWSVWQDSYWIGLSSTSNGGLGNFAWEDGSTYSDFHWGSQQPDGDDPDQWCTYVRSTVWGNDWSWAIADCSDNKNVSCSYKP